MSYFLKFFLILLKILKFILQQNLKYLTPHLTIYDKVVILKMHILEIS